MTDTAESIMDDLKTALEQIATGSNYNYTVETVTRKDKDIDDVTEAEAPWIMLSDPVTRRERVGGGDSVQDRVWLTTMVTGVVYSDDAETDANKFKIDIIQAALTESTAPHKQIDECTSIDVMNTIIIAEGQKGQCVVEFEIFYTEVIT